MPRPSKSKKRNTNDTAVLISSRVFGYWCASWSAATSEALSGIATNAKGTKKNRVNKTSGSISNQVTIDARPAKPATHDDRIREESRCTNKNGQNPIKNGDIFPSILSRLANVKVTGYKNKSGIERFCKWEVCS